MDKFVDYKEVPIGDKNYWEVDRDLVRGGVGNKIGWNIGSSCIDRQCDFNSTYK